MLNDDLRVCNSSFAADRPEPTQARIGVVFVAYKLTGPNGEKRPKIQPDEAK